MVWDMSFCIISSDYDHSLISVPSMVSVTRHLWLMGGVLMAKWFAISFGKMLKKAGFQRSTLSSHRMRTPDLWPTSYNIKGGTIPHLRLVWEAQLSVGIHCVMKTNWGQGLCGDITVCNAYLLRIAHADRRWNWNPVIGSRQGCSVQVPLR